jgi:hypothetical protein
MVEHWATGRDVDDPCAIAYRKWYSSLNDMERHAAVRASKGLAFVAGWEAAMKQMHEDRIFLRDLED